MQINKIKIHNFKSIYGTFEMDFNRIKGFWKIDGKVGAGKTTIGEAIIFGLFGDVKGINNRELISWGEKNGYIEINCTVKEHNLFIKREIRGDIYVEVDNEPLIFTNKRDAQKQLEEEYFDVSKLTFELLCIISFNSFTSLSNMTPHDTRIFLDQVFGFAELTEYINKSKDNTKIASGELLKTEYKHTNIVSQINKIKELSNLSIIEGNISDLNEEYKNYNKEKSDLKAKNKLVIDELNTKIRNKRNELAEIKVLGENKAKEIAFIEKGTCPTCGAKIDDSQLEIKRSERIALLNSYKAIKESIDSLVKEKEEKEKANELAIKELTEKINSIIAHKAKLEEQEKRSHISKTEIQKLQKEKNEILKEIDTQKKDVEEWTQLTDLLSTTIKQKILNCFIPLLNKSIASYTRKFNLPYEIIFDEQFKCNIKSSNREKPINISSLSTGQLKTVDMCCILGVVKAIFTGANCNILFLDELFSNMDTELREIACNILREDLKNDHTIFIISHQDISDYNFDGYISAELYFENGQKKSKYTIREV